MATPKNILKTWFSYLKKPTESQFWAWIDAFWHRDELIPPTSIDGLDGILNKKADLVNDKLPTEQLPDSIQQNLQAEIDARISADDNLADALEVEANFRASVDNTLTANIQTEAIRNTNQDSMISQLQSAISVLQNWKSSLTDADSDNLVNTLTELLASVQNVPEGTDIFALINSKVNISDVINNLISLETNKPLSAYQGKILNDLINALQSHVNSLNLDDLADVNYMGYLNQYGDEVWPLENDDDSFIIKQKDSSFWVRYKFSQIKNRIKGYLDSFYKPIGWFPTWAEITGKPTTFTPSTHQHAIADITLLAETLLAKVAQDRKIAGIDLVDDITATELTAVLNAATPTLKGLMSAIDKSRLDALSAILGESDDTDTVVNTINEVLAIFQNYPEGATFVNALAGKANTDGSNATGTWGISITGNAATATKFANARTIKIGNTSKSFDGSENISWSLNEIGLAIEVTLTNASNLITNNQIVPGALYKITGCDVNLYNDGTSSGTTIYLQGITSNSFSKSGYGEFYNPPYNQSINGYGIWTNYMTGNFTKTSSLTFAVNEYLIANNGATGYYAGDGLIRYNSGDWSGATSVTGNSYGATANVSFFTNPSYSIGTTVIWGGYMWTNLTGSLGSFYNDIILDSINWAKVPYSSGLYNKVLDVIDYDILSDKIVKRNEVEFNNLVAITSSRSAYFSVSNGGMYNNPIALFQWGNKYNGSSKGLSDVRIYDSIFSCINFRGNYLQDIIFENGSSHNANYYHNSSAYKLRITNNSSIYNNVFNNTFPNNIEIDNNSSISSNLFYSGSVNTIKMSNSTISSNSIWGGGIYNNFLDGSNINSNRMYSSPIYQNKLIKNCGIYSNYSSSTSNGIYNNSLEQNCNIYSNTLKGGSTHGIYNNELIVNCNIYSNTLNANNDNIQLNTLKVGSNIYGNNLLNISGIYINNLVGSNIYNNTINNSNIEGNTAVRSTIWGNNISAGSNIRRITLMGSSSINSLNFTSTTMSACTLNGTTFNSTASISGKQIFYLTFNGVSVSQDLSSATLFYGLTYKNVLSRADSTPVIQYIDNSNVLQTVPITT